MRSASPRSPNLSLIPTLSLPLSLILSLPLTLLTLSPATAAADPDPRFVEFNAPPSGEAPGWCTLEETEWQWRDAGPEEYKNQGTWTWDTKARKPLKRVLKLGAWKDPQVTEWKYDKAGNLVQWKWTWGKGRDLVRKFKNDKDGRIVSEERVDKEKPGKKTITYEYDANGRVVKAIEVVSKDRKPVETEYLWDEAGRSLGYLRRSANFFDSWGIRWTRDAAGRIVQEDSGYAEGVEKGEAQYGRIYELDANGDPAVITDVHRWNDQGERRQDTDARYDFTFDANHNPLTAEVSGTRTGRQIRSTKWGYGCWDATAAPAAAK
jgi:hypothetical protein